MKRAVVISCYYGTLPPTFEYWAKSCEYNSEFDFILVTDQSVELSIPNLIILNMSFSQLCELIKEKLGKDVCIPKPYKLCDFKPAYGLIFQEHVAGYEFWGHCDIDMVMGKLKSFITDEVMDHHDKILYLGHLSLYRNVDRINQLCTERGGLDLDWNTIYSEPLIFGIDEDQGIYSAMIKQGYAVFSERIFFDIFP